MYSINDTSLLIPLLYGISFSIVSSLKTLSKRYGSLFSFTSFWINLLKTSCLSVSPTALKSVPISWLIESTATSYFLNFLNLTCSSSLFSVRQKCYSHLQASPCKITSNFNKSPALFGSELYWNPSHLFGTFMVCHVIFPVTFLICQVIFPVTFMVCHVIFSVNIFNLPPYIPWNFINSVKGFWLETFLFIVLIFLIFFFFSWFFLWEFDRTRRHQIFKFLAKIGLFNQKLCLHLRFCWKMGLFINNFGYACSLLQFIIKFLKKCKQFIQ